MSFSSKFSAYWLLLLIQRDEFIHYTEDLGLVNQKHRNYSHSYPLFMTEQINNLK